MKLKINKFTAIHFVLIQLVCAGFIFNTSVKDAAAQIPKRTNKPTSTQAKDKVTIRVVVDPRIELLSIIFRLAENGEFNQNRFKKYSADVDAHFSKFREHPAVQYARRMREERKICCDAVMSMAVHLGKPPEMKQRAAYKSTSLEKRWQPDEAREFSEKAHSFMKDSDFRSFVRAKQPMYKLAESRMQKLVDEQIDQKWFTGFFGERPQSSFVLTVGLLTGRWNFYSSFRSANGKEELYAVIGASIMDEEGMPKFDEGVLSTIIHEFNHAFINPAIAKREAAFGSAGEFLYTPVAAEMRKQGYTNWKTMIDESLVRAAVARYLLAHQGAEAAAKEVEQQKLLGYLWLDDLFALLGVYENNRARYPTFEAFLPNIVAYFRDLAPRLSVKVAQFESRRPRVVAMTPVNQSKDVNPELTEIKFTFDRPMNRETQALISEGGKQNQFPEIRGPGKFWEFDNTGTVFTMRVRLKPNSTYEFLLNSESNPGFQSTEGLALKSYRVQFQTGSSRN